MANATSLPTYTNNKFFFWNGRLTDSLDNSTSDQTVYWDTVPVDENGATITGAFLIAVRNTRRNPNRTELMWVPASAVAADGLSATGVIRGLKPSGLDFTAGSSSFVYEFDSGDEIFCAILPQDGELLRSAIQGVIGTGASDFRIGDGTAGNKTIYAQNADSNKPFIRYDDTTNQWIISNDGTSSFVPGTGAGAITGGDGISVTAGDIDVDVTDTTVFVQTSSGAGDSGKIARLDASGKLATGFITAAPLATYISDVTATATQINNFSSGQLTKTYTAYEAISDNDAVCLLPVEVEHFAQLTDVDLAFGDVNARARYAIKIIPTQTTSTLTTMQFRAREQSAGATALGNLTISIQLDSAGAPSGTAITNGTANVIDQATQRTWGSTMGTRTATWASSPTLTAGTTYWIVFQTDSIDAANYLHLGVNSNYDENYLTFTRLTYDAFGPSWGSSVTNATPFFWFNSQVYLLGQALCQADANWGGRTWNFIGFAQGAISANASGSVEYNIAGLTGLTPNKSYYLSTTAGGITTTPTAGVYTEGTAPTAFIYKIGRSLGSTTELQVRPGSKRVFIREATQITASTTRQYILWFRPEFIRVDGGGLSGSVGTEGGSAAGFDTFGTPGASVMQVGPTTNGSGTGNTTNSFDTGSVLGGNYFLANASFTDAGFTYTYTETGTANFTAIIEAVAE